MKQNDCIWRPILIRLNSVLEWERKYDPMIIFTVVTLIFVFILRLELSVLTFVSSLIFIGLIVENIVPFILTFFFDSNDSNRSIDDDEKKYERFCQRWNFVKQTVINQYRCLRSFQNQQPKEYFILGVIFLLILTIYAQTLDNILLSYYSILIACLIPGIHHQQLISVFWKILRHEFHRFFP